MINPLCDYTVSHSIFVTRNLLEACKINMILVESMLMDVNMTLIGSMPNGVTDLYSVFPKDYEKVSFPKKSEPNEFLSILCFH